MPLVKNIAFGPTCLSITLLAVSTLTIMVGSVLAPALPEVAARVGMTTYPSLLITLPALGVIMSAPFVGRLIDRFGGKSVLLVGLIFYGGLGLIGGWISSVNTMALDRFLLGIATALIMASGTSLIAEHYQGESRLKMIARQGMAIEVGGIIFLSISGILASIFCKLPFGLYLLAWVYVLPAAIIIPKSASSYSASNPEELSKKFHGEWSIFIVATVSMLIFFAAFITLPHVLSDADFSETDIGIYLGGISFVAVLSAGVMPKFRRKFASTLIFSLAFSAYGIAHLLYRLDISLVTLLASGFLLGLGFGLTIPLCNYEVLNRSQKAERNRNLAYLSSAIFLGQVLSSSVEFLNFSPAMIFFLMTIISFMTCVFVVRHLRQSSCLA